jgi:hypothetical protein
MKICSHLPIKRLAFTALATALLTAQTASAQSVLLNSWENSVEGWGPLQTNWASVGFSPSTGITDGAYSWQVMAFSNPDYGAAFGGPSSTNVTFLLANADSVSFDVNVPGGGQGSFGFFLQFDLTVNQQGGIGYQSVDGYTYSQSANIGGQKTLTFAIPAGIRSGLAANIGLPASLNFQIGGGGGGNLYLDNLRVQVPEPGTMALLGLGAGALILMRRHSR